MDKGSSFQVLGRKTLCSWLREKSLLTATDISSHRVLLVLSNFLIYDMRMLIRVTGWRSEILTQSISREPGTHGGVPVVLVGRWPRATQHCFPWHLGLCEAHAWCTFSKCWWGTLFYAFTYYTDIWAPSVAPNKGGRRHLTHPRHFIVLWDKIIYQINPRKVTPRWVVVPPMTSELMEHRADFEIPPQLCGSLHRGWGGPFYLWLCCQNGAWSCHSTLLGPGNVASLLCDWRII